MYTSRVVSATQSECARMHFLIEIALGGVAAEIYNRRPESPCSNSTLYILPTLTLSQLISAQIW
jgi:hypothetical protein